MKTALLTIAVLFTAVPAFAQEREQQVYYPYKQAAEIGVYEARIENQQAQMSFERSLQRQGTGRIYPGRERYGTQYGPIPRHPGDYKDAVDRGSWSGGGGGGQPGTRAFSLD